MNAERLYEDGNDPQLLDVIDLSLSQPKPFGCHTEDIRVDATKRWIKRGRLTYQKALELIPTSSRPLWADGKDSSNGVNDMIDQIVAANLPDSLRLIRPDQLAMTATAEYANKRKVRGEFSLGTAHYKLTITDPRIEQEFLQYEVGVERIAPKPLLCISIGEPFEPQKACYKLIAGVMER